MNLKNEGEIVDNWSLDELENKVIEFQRMSNENKDLVTKFKLEEIHLEKPFKDIYYKRIQLELKK